MEAEEVLNLFDSCWFERGIFMCKHDPPAPAAKFVHQRIDESEESKICGVPNLQIRSLSDRCLGLNESNYFKEEAAAGKAASPRSVLIKPKLQKIFSGKEIIEFSREVAGQEKAEKLSEKKQCNRTKKGREGLSRSLSALEFEEVKGFMDLGFVFTEEDKTSSLVSIIPGLQKWGKMADDEQVEEKAEVSRPYLSEAWGVLNRRRGFNNPLMNWRIPPVQNEINMKDHLRIWAQTVASNFR
ncbi:hypothetical protein Pfo_022517 [Paulownia fortunei]|nr:hypothetical protein Pfo_022517 [Paulownia fortunei]